MSGATQKLRLMTHNVWNNDKNHSEWEKRGADCFAAVRANGFRHAHDIATEYAEEAVGYHYCFASCYETEYYDWPFEKALDHIYVIGEDEGAVKRFERYSSDYYFSISDHSPAYVDLEI